MGNRVAEILDTTNIEQWYHVKSKDNISDIGTRNNAPVVDICEHSEWHNAPVVDVCEHSEWHNASVVDICEHSEWHNVPVVDICEHSEWQDAPVVDICEHSEWQNASVVDICEHSEWHNASVVDICEHSEWHNASVVDICEHSEWHNAPVVDICEHSEWQDGSNWMSLPIEQWPVSQDTGSENVPGDELLQSKFSGHAKAMESPISFDKYKSKSYQFVINLIARVLKIAKNKSFKYIDIVPEDLEKAELYVLKSSMVMTKDG